MLYTGMIEAFIIVFILSAVGSLVLNMVFRFLVKKVIWVTCIQMYVVEFLEL